MELPYIPVYIGIPLFSIAVIVFTYQWVNTISGFISKTTVNQRVEILRLCTLMFIDMSEEKLNKMLTYGSVGLAALAFLVCLPNFVLGFVLAIVLASLVWLLPASILKDRYEKRCNQIVDQMVDGLTIMANGIGSGLGVTQALERVAENLNNPIRQEFKKVLSEVTLGRTLEDALIDFGERVPRPDVQMFVTSITILKETGGNLAETFTTIVAVIRDRQKLEKKIQAMTAMGVTQGVILTLVPFALLALFSVMNPDHISPLFSSFAGIVLLIIMIGLVIIAGISIKKIVTIKV